MLALADNDGAADFQVAHIEELDIAPKVVEQVFTRCRAGGDAGATGAAEAQAAAVEVVAPAVEARHVASLLVDVLQELVVHLQQPGLPGPLAAAALLKPLLIIQGHYIHQNVVLDI